MTRKTTSALTGESNYVSFTTAAKGIDDDIITHELAHKLKLHLTVKSRDNKIVSGFLVNLALIRWEHLLR